MCELLIVIWKGRFHFALTVSGGRKDGVVGADRGRQLVARAPLRRPYGHVPRQLRVRHASSSRDAVAESSWRSPACGGRTQDVQYLHCSHRLMDVSTSNDVLSLEEPVTFLRDDKRYESCFATFFFSALFSAVRLTTGCTGKSLGFPCG